jgi:hypothetical protein
MSAKTIISDLGQTGLIIYAVVQNAAGNYFDNIDGLFRVSPASPAIALTEDTLIKGRYANRNVGIAAAWANGTYSIAIFRQVGVSPSLSSDIFSGSGEIQISSDVEINISNIYTDTAKAATSALETTAQTILGVVNTINLESANNVLKTLVRFNLFEYKGMAGNVFSKVKGSFVGSIKFYSVDVDDFLADSAHPPLTNLICTLNSNGTMSDTSGIAVTGDLLFMTLVGFQALEDVVINYYNDHIKSNTRFYIPKDIVTVSSSVPYYPSVFGILLSNVNSGTIVTPLTDYFINKNIFEMSEIDWDRISAPIVVNQPTVLFDNVVNMSLTLDRTISLQFDLHRDISGNSIYFAMKSDRNNEFYDVDPITCTIDDATKGLISLEIPEDATVNLDASKYYGELLRRTASGKFQTLVKFNIDVSVPIISTRDL